MKREATISQGDMNAPLIRDFLLYLGRHPELAKDLPKGAHVVLIPSDNAELAVLNLKMAADLLSEGKQVVLVRWPVLSSRRTRAGKNPAAVGYMAIGR